MPKKQYPSGNQDQFVLRMPDGMRDRIRAYADRQGTSMNTEMVRALEGHFPAQWPLEERVEFLTEQLEFFANSPSNETLEAFSTELHKTLLGVLTGRTIVVPEEFRKSLIYSVEEYFGRIEKLKFDQHADSASEELEEFVRRYTHEERAAFRVVEFPEKYPTAPPAELMVPPYDKMSEYEQAIYDKGKSDAYAGMIRSERRQVETELDDDPIKDEK